MFTPKIISQYRLVRYNDSTLVSKIRGVNPIDNVKLHNEFDVDQKNHSEIPLELKNKSEKKSKPEENSQYQLQGRGSDILKAADLAQHHLKTEAYKPYELLKYENASLRIVVLSETFDSKLVEWASMIAKLYQARLFFLHLCHKNDDKSVIENKWKKIVVDVLEPCKGAVQFFDFQPEFAFIDYKIKMLAIQNYLNHCMANFLILGHESHSLIERIFNADLSEQLLLKMDLPMLIIPKKRDIVGIKNVLVLVDKLPFSLDAIKQGMQFATDLRASLYFFHVHETEGEISSSFEFIKKSLQISSDLVHDQWLVEQGDFLEMIDKVIQEHQIDLVVFGTHITVNDSESGSRTLAIINAIDVPCLILHPRPVL